MKIAIIGGGAAGIMASITAKRLNKNIEIDIFDANKSIGKKILASGNGRCNISNTTITSKNYLGENPTFVDFALKEFDFKTFEKFCKTIGLLLDIKESGKVYPLSNEAKSVTNLFSIALDELNVNILYEQIVQKVEKQNDKFVIYANDKEFKSYDKVLISSGLAAAPQLNSTEIGLQIASSFGHSFNPTYPSLVGLQTKDTYKGKLQGVKKECSVSLYINGNFEQDIFGDVLFTAYGVSGFAILDISQRAVLALSKFYDVELRINFFPKTAVNDLANQIQTLFKNLPNQKAVDILTGLVSNKIAPILLEICKIDLNTKAHEINTKQIKSLAHQLNSWRLKVIDTQGFSHAEASGGGIRTLEIDNKTYESKIVKNLFFAGEVLDIVGNRGGYNLHFAWASGYLAGKSLSNI
ncbi:aminoacetone oxidase family FAD-binding enzyme [Aliarcobacter cryaerophilus ATCC 43158]|uniref:Flavoprotein, HI0933 family n=1 Tax=Aliarcobacter cryaerophilus ATCC 43158 TaxID=1032070 RepID=A0AAD0TQT5_9BACT|nr:NAD(P)/FAD-dependent oxidoreductase [Aliarcobacter cryaerophilus]AYJ79201.1 flavoprotein, HI0933 family [Aliarcobacter cryaerophilus ATCC 43158]PRM96770.1 aminoacetone oxidase family FAD-binding enzyme [Aliarcobacter cryaerophilus]QCZ23465.1 aminoacetone oxidase family FAD-binding enzyme [Aliarcobacter cryaerophilus ATCC 43158]